MNDGEIITVQQPNCFLCGAVGEVVYNRLFDRVFGSQGEWNFKKCTNQICGMYWLDPMPIEDDIFKLYQNYYTHQQKVNIPDNMLRWLYSKITRGYLANRYRYDIDGVTLLDRMLGLLVYLHPGRMTDINFKVFFLNANHGGKLLEVGCGNGFMLKRLANLGWTVEGVDFDINAVRTARTMDLNVHLGDLSEQYYPDSTFDAIVMSHVIEHVYDPLALLVECQRILKPGGRLINITPNIDSWGHRMFREYWRGLEPPRHLHIFNISSLQILAKKAGFSRINCRSIARARGVLLASKSLRNTGKIKDTGRYPFKDRLWAELFELIEWTLLIFNKNYGEEVVLCAIK